MKIKNYSFLLLTLLLSSSIFAQSKKALEQQLEASKESIGRLESEIQNIRTRLNNTNESLGNTLKTNADLMEANAQLTSTNTDLLHRINQEKRNLSLAIHQIDSLTRMVRLLQIDSDFITHPRNQKDSIIAVLQPFYAAMIWEDRLDYVLEPNQIKSQMAIFYSQYPNRAILKAGQVTFLERDSTDLNLQKVGVGNNIIYLRKKEQAYKIDWAASYGANEIPTAIFKKTTDTDAKEFRVLASLSNSYLSPYTNKKQTHWSIELKTIYPEEEFNGYIAKDSQEGQKIYELLENGGTQRLILKMIKNQEDKTEKVTEITELIQTDWSKK